MVGSAGAVELGALFCCFSLTGVRAISASSSLRFTLASCSVSGDCELDEAVGGAFVLIVETVSRRRGCIKSRRLFMLVWGCRAMHMSCHGIQIDSFLSDMAKQVRDEHCFRNRLDENNALKLSVGQASETVIVETLSRKFCNPKVCNVLASKATFGGPWCGLNVAKELLIRNWGN